MRRTPAAPSWSWMYRHTVWRCAPACRARASSASVDARRAGRPVGVGDAMTAARRADVLAEQLAGLRIEQRGRGGRSTGPGRAARSSRAASSSTRPRLRRSHRDGRCGRRSGSSETARRAAAAARAAPRQTSRRPGAWSCRGCACRPSARPSDRDRPAPASSVSKRWPVQRRLLCMADAGFDLALAIGIADATREADDAVVREHVAIERIERRLVDVGREHALFEVVEDDDARRAAQPTKRPLVELGPRLRTRLPHQQAHRLARVARA